MPQLTESAAEQLTPKQATELVRVLDLQATWDNHRNDPTKSAAMHFDLHARQKAFDAFQVAWRGYTVKYPGVLLPEPSQNVPDRLAAWCRVLRVVFQRAGGTSRQVITKVYRLADGIAARMSEEPLVRTAPEDLSDIVPELGIVISWCDKFAKPLTPLGLLMKEPQGTAA